MKSLVLGRTSRGSFADCLNKANLHHPDGHRWSQQSAGEVMAKLRQKGLLTTGEDCVPALLHPIAIDAMASQDGPRPAFMVRKVLPLAQGGSRPDPYPAMRYARLAIYENDADAFRVAQEMSGAAELTVFLANCLGMEILAPDWLANRATPIRFALMEAKLAILLVTVEAQAEVLQWIKQPRHQLDEPSVLQLQRYDVLAGHLDRMRGWATDEKVTNGAAIAGSVAFLTGDTQAALAHYRTALRDYRKAASRKNVFLPDVHGVLFAMALIQATTRCRYGRQRPVWPLLPRSPRLIRGRCWLCRHWYG